MFSPYSGDAGGDALCATLYAGGCEGWALFAGDVDVSEAMRYVLLSMLEAVKGELCLLEVSKVPEVMRCVLSVCWRCWR